jgi:hypothetical protein
LIYCVPHPFADLIPHAFGSLNFEPNRLGYPMSGFVSLLGQTFLEWRQWLDGLIASTTAKSVFGIKDELVPPNGSGDTTYNYILLLAGFVLALLIAVIWSLIDSRRRTDYAITRDLLRSYLRYYLAFWMLTYGLAKVSLDANQFPYIGQFQLDRTWGETSPMGVLWRFMGSSRPYTIFAGLGEVLAAVLLIWRRTGTLGALVAMGVSLNIVLLNFCYDVPVKIFSSHLLVAAMLIAIPDLNRLANLLVFNRPTTGDRSPSLWQFGLMNRIRIAAKSFVILLGFALPLAAQAWNVGSHFVKPTLTEQRDPKANSSKSLLERRGFRWINEVPFNR